MSVPRNGGPLIRQISVVPEVGDILARSFLEDLCVSVEES